MSVVTAAHSCGGPLLGDQIAAERRPVAIARIGASGVLRGSPRVAVEQPVFVAAVPLRGEQTMRAVLWRLLLPWPGVYNGFSAGTIMATWEGAEQEGIACGSRWSVVV